MWNWIKSFFDRSRKTVDVYKFLSLLVLFRLWTSKAHQLWRSADGTRFHVRKWYFCLNRESFVCVVTILLLLRDYLSIVFSFGVVTFPNTGFTCAVFSIEENCSRSIQLFINDVRYGTLTPAASLWAHVGFFDGSDNLLQLKIWFHREFLFVVTFLSSISFFNTVVLLSSVWGNPIRQKWTDEIFTLPTTTSLMSKSLIIWSMRIFELWTVPILVGTRLLAIFSHTLWIYDIL